jgi:hypothetical protein
MKGDDVEMGDDEKVDEAPIQEEYEKTPGGKVVIETEETNREWRARYNGGVGKALQAKRIRAVYEVSLTNPIYIHSLN